LSSPGKDESDLGLWGFFNSLEPFLCDGASCKGSKLAATEKEDARQIIEFVSSWCWRACITEVRSISLCICPVHSFIFFRRSTIQVFLFDSCTFCMKVFFLGSNSRVIKLNLLIKYKIETQKIKVEKIL
jgi:hypothetical protein